MINYGFSIDAESKAYLPWSSLQVEWFFHWNWKWSLLPIITCAGWVVFPLKMKVKFIAHSHLFMSSDFSIETEKNVYCPWSPVQFE